MSIKPFVFSRFVFGAGAVAVTLAATGGLPPAPVRAGVDAHATGITGGRGAGAATRQQTLTCPKCHTAYVAGQKFCKKCGTKLPQPEAKRLAESAQRFLYLDSLAEAGRDAEAAISLDTDLPLAHAVMGNVLAERGDVVASKIELNKVSQSLALTAIGFGVLYELEKKWPEAIDAYQKALKRDPSDTRAAAKLKHAREEDEKAKAPQVVVAPPPPPVEITPPPPPVPKRPNRRTLSSGTALEADEVTEVYAAFTPANLLVNGGFEDLNDQHQANDWSEEKGTGIEDETATPVNHCLRTRKAGSFFLQEHIGKSKIVPGSRYVFALRVRAALSGPVCFSRYELQWRNDRGKQISVSAGQWLVSDETWKPFGWTVEAPSEATGVTVKITQITATPDAAGMLYDDILLTLDAG